MQAFLLLFVVALSAVEAEDFKIYWNIPLGHCENSGVHFNLSKYGVIHNKGNAFRGDKVNIWYRPGKFPYLEDGEAVNGGLPMEGDIKGHIESFLTMLNNLNLTASYDGISVLDFEKYVPYYDVLSKEYKIPSRAWVRHLYPNTTELENVTRAVFNAQAVPFLQDLLTVHAAGFPKALTGYYKYPGCNNFQAPYDSCVQKMKDANDYLQEAIFKTSTALFPSIYIFEHYGSNYMTYINTVLQETKRVNKKKLPVFPYFWYRFHEKEDFLPKTYFLNIMIRLKSELEGVVFWGSAKDIKDVASCTKFKEYMDTVMGPALDCLARIPRPTLARLSHLGGAEVEPLVEALLSTACPHLVVDG